VVPRPPVAEQRPHDVVSPFGTRSDPYYWLRDDTRTDPAVLAHLAAEAAYAAAMLAPAQLIEDAIALESRARLAEDDVSAPIFDAGYWYYVRHVAGQQYAIHARKRGESRKDRRASERASAARTLRRANPAQRSTPDAPEEILIDGNDRARGHAFYELGDYAVSRDGTLLAWTEDTLGRNQFTLRVKNLATGELMPDTATGIASAVVWANDNRTVFFVGKDPTTLREDRVLRLRLGDAGAPVVVHEERDPAFYVGVSATKSRRYIAIELDATTMSETRLVDADRPQAAPRTFIPRTADHIYEVEHVGARFIVRTNDRAENFRVVEVPAARPARRAGWRDLIRHRADVLVEGFVAYERFVAANVRRGGLARVEIVARGRAPRLIDGGDASFVMSLVDTPDPRATHVRYIYDSLIAPTTTYEVDVASGARTVVHREPAPTYDPASYATEYVHAKAADGTRVPVSLVYRNTTPRDGTAPLLVTGYGAYGTSLEPVLERTRVSLLDRGFVVAIAHVRGGQELGSGWYEAGRLLAKENTFGDFIAATELLVAERYAARDRMFAEGASAGGLVMGVIANRRPELYRGIVAWVPFVDVVTTMLDPSLPLVTNEYDEWGDPRADQATYDYQLGYSPYDNVRAQAYPALYVRTGLHDSQVPYHESAKWVAKLRAHKTDANLLLLETDLAAGHGGKSGRYDAIREQARAYAFVLHALGR
jgi:oligopeptidase B